MLSKNFWAEITYTLLSQFLPLNQNARVLTMVNYIPMKQNKFFASFKNYFILKETVKGGTTRTIYLFATSPKKRDQSNSSIVDAHFW
jgi:hypothetical protein